MDNSFKKKCLCGAYIELYCDDGGTMKCEKSHLLHKCKNDGSIKYGKMKCYMSNAQCPNIKY